MYGAILGDIVGSPYEFDQGNKSKEFPLFTGESHFTDDTVMTIAVAEALMETAGDPDDDVVLVVLVDRLQYWGRKYPDAGYGARFTGWLQQEHPLPYGSYGNGSKVQSRWPVLYIWQERDTIRMTFESMWKRRSTMI